MSDFWSKRVKLAGPAAPGLAVFIVGVTSLRVVTIIAPSLEFYGSSICFSIAAWLCLALMVIGVIITIYTFRSGSAPVAPPPPMTGDPLRDTPPPARVRRARRRIDNQ